MESFSNESLFESSLVAEPKIEHDVSRFYFPFVRIDNRRLPHDLVVNLYNQTYHDVPDFEAAIFESIEMVYPDGRRKVLLAADQPQPERTFPVGKGNSFLTEESQVRFAGAVDRPDSFVLTCRGTAVSQSGPRIPFETRLRYRYDGKSKSWRWTTLAESDPAAASEHPFPIPTLFATVLCFSKSPLILLRLPSSSPFQWGGERTQRHTEPAIIGLTQYAILARS